MKTILVVDDTASVRQLLQDYLTQQGFRIVTASNGQEAIYAARHSNPDAILLDIMMPQMDGLELAEKIREMESTLPVVVMTGYPSLENSIQTLKNGVVDYLIKPVNLEQMELTLKRILRERELFIENLILKEEVERQERLKLLNQELMERVEEVNTLKSELKQMDRLVRVKVEETKESLQRQLTALEQQLKSNEIAILEKDNKNAGLTQEIIKLNASIDQLIVDKNSMEKALYSLTDKYEKTIIMYKENVSELEMINSSNNLEKENERSIKSEIDDALKLIEIYK